MSSAKKNVCPVCGKRFSTKAAMNQHRNAVHKSSSKARTDLVGSSMLVTPAGYPNVVRGGGRNVARISGRERIFGFSLTGKEASGTILASLLITPASFERLATVARAFQRIRYRRLRFEIVSQNNIMSTGGYVAGFIRDPDDSSARTLASLSSVQGSVSTKWWQSAALDATPPNRLFYTSEGLERREYSPGKFVLAVDSPSTQVGYMSIFADWDAELESPMMESPSDMEKPITVRRNLYTRNMHQGLWAKMKPGPPNQDDDSMWSSRIADMFSPTPTVGSFMHLKVPTPFLSSAGSMRIANWLYARDSNTLLPCFSGKSDQDAGRFTKIDLAIREGEELTLDAGEFEQGGYSGVRQSTLLAETDSGHLSASCQCSASKLKLLVSSLGELLNDFSQQCHSDVESLDSTEKL